LSRDSGFGFQELLKTECHILISLWTAKREMLEEENKAENKSYEEQKNSQQIPNMQSMMGSMKGMMPSMPSVNGISLPSVGGFKR
jgi:hypothetical protein